MKMEMSSAQWLSELGMEDPALVRQCSNLSSPTAEQLATMMGYQHNIKFDSSASFSSFNSMETLGIPSVTTSMGFQLGVSSSEGLAGYERPLKIPKTNQWDSASAQLSCPSVYSSNDHQNFQLQQHCMPQQLENYRTSLPKLKDDIYETVAPRTPTIQVEIMGSQAPPGHKGFISDNHGVDAFNFSEGREFSVSKWGKLASDMGVVASTKNTALPAKTSYHTQDHIMAERKRREKLSQRFIALSAIVPGLKKMDKASVLDDAIKYVKKLQERLNVLEKQAPQKTVQSVVYVNKSPLSSESGKTSSVDNSSGETVDDSVGLLTPEIEARVVDRNVLIRIHCEKRKGLLLKFLAELEKLMLTVINASILSFSETTLDLTFSAQMEEGCTVTVTEIVKTLEALFMKMT